MASAHKTPSSARICVFIARDLKRPVNTVRHALGRLKSRDRVVCVGLRRDAVVHMVEADE